MFVCHGAPSFAAETIVESYKAASDQNIAIASAEQRVHDASGNKLSLGCPARNRDGGRRNEIAPPARLCGAALRKSTALQHVCHRKTIDLVSFDSTRLTHESLGYQQLLILGCCCCRCQPSSCFELGVRHADNELLATKDEEDWASHHPASTCSVVDSTFQFSPSSETRLWRRSTSIIHSGLLSGLTLESTTASHHLDMWSTAARTCSQVTYLKRALRLGCTGMQHAFVNRSQMADAARPVLHTHTNAGRRRHGHGAGWKPLLPSTSFLQSRDCNETARLATVRQAPIGQAPYLAIGRVLASESMGPLELVQ